ncbi:MAG: T9SS type A sorting domain-containing protein [bacterium]|nr:T9SS type A sorting domain-containing protein [bacterium]
MKFGMSKLYAMSIATMLILFVVPLAFGVSVTQIGYSASTGASDVTVDRGDTVFVKMTLDLTGRRFKDVCDYDNNVGSITLLGYDESDNLDFNDPVSFTLTSPGTTPSTSTNVQGYFVVPSNWSGTTTRLDMIVTIRTYPAIGTASQYTNGYVSYYDLTGLDATIVTVNSAFGATYDNLRMTLNADVTQAPTLTTPSGSYQGGRDNSTIKVKFTIPEAATASSMKLYIKTGGGSTVQTITFSNTTAATYSGTLQYSGGTFSVVAASNDGGTTLPTIDSQTNTTALANGTTYNVIIGYQDAAGHDEATANYASFVYDTGTQSTTWTAPTSGQAITLNGSPDNFNFQWTNAEVYNSLVLSFINASDLNSPHELTLASSFFTSGAKNVTVDLSNITSDANFTYNNPDGTALELGLTYTCRIAAIDLPINSAINSNTSFSTTDGATTAPTLTTPANSSRDNATLSLAYTLNEQAYDASVKLRWFPAGGPYTSDDVLRTWTMTSEQSGAHTGSVTLTNGLVSTGGGSNSDFGVNVASDSGVTAITAGTYDLRLDMRDADQNPVASSTIRTSFTMDTQTSAPAITSPASNTSGTSLVLVYNQPEAATATTKTVSFTRTGGSADGNSHVLVFTAGNLASGNGQTHTFSGSDLDGNATVVTLQGGSTNSLVNGAYYTVTLSYQDDLGNTAASTTITNWMYTTSVNNANVAGTAYPGYLAQFPENLSNKRIYRVSMYTNSGTNTLTSVTFTIGGSANSSDFAAGGFKLWYSANANAATFPADGAQIGSGQSYGNSVTFSGLSQQVTTSTSYIYLTVSLSSNVDDTHNITSTVNAASDITFASGTAAGSFPLEQGDNLLPVELSQFDASSRNGSVHLQWVTESEVNNAGFEVLRKLDGATDYSVVASYSSATELRSQTENGTSSDRHNYSFVDNTVVPGSAYTYALRSIDLDGVGEMMSMTVNVTVSQLPTEFALLQNYPNPFNNSTTVRFALPNSAKMTLAVYDITGREVIRLIDGDIPAGSHAVNWNGKNASGTALSSGTYFMQMKAGNFKSTRKIALLK